jgi:serine protease 16
MKFLLFVAGLLGIIHHISKGEIEHYEWLQLQKFVHQYADFLVFYFHQPRDHFDSNNKHYFKQKFYMDTRFYTKGGPVFLTIGGEHSIQMEGVEMMLATALSRRHRGIHFALEHRYYGNHTSIPVHEFDTHHLQWLTPEQAMADAVRFIKHKTKEHKLQDSKWVVIGGSYAGNLAAWLRLKHPDLVFAAHVSSAPLNVIQEFPEYSDGVYEAVSASAGDTRCVDGWSRAIQTFDKMVAETNGTFVREMFNAPENLSIGDLSLLSRFFWISVQEGISPPQIDMDGTKVSYVEAICSGKWFPAFVNPEASNDELLASFIMLSRVQFPSPEEFQQLNTKINPEKQNDRPWYYQICTQFGWFQGPSLKNYTLFSKNLDLEYHKWTCRLYFGKRYPQVDPDHYNKKYHGLDIVHKVDRIVYVTGDNDPWTKVAVTPDMVKKSQLDNHAVMIKGGFHCKDLHVPLPFHPPSYREAHEKIMGIWDRILGKPTLNTFDTKYYEETKYQNYMSTKN